MNCKKANKTNLGLHKLFKIMKLLAIVLFGLFTVNLSAQISHKQWDELVKEHVTESGKVDYEGFFLNKEHLDAYLTLLSNNAPKSSWTKNETLAYWINAYNAFTVKLIVKHYPVKSIKDLGGSIYSVNTSWDIKFIKIGNEELDLNNIEHQKIRGQFNEPRIHFAINCASVSCPRLRNEAFTANNLEAQLTDQTEYFLQYKIKNDLSDPKNPKVSKLFNWYSADFKIDGKTVTDFINKYSTSKVPEGTILDYLDYNWNLNH
ncbi:MAG: hypothetical protein ACI8YC_000237 [Salibacteraceae bacterium]|jgi:hypothetical protein|tara:strand:- start:36 stop:818 length:783 start_codon:yes stop_codon:yes gene_type:complete